jgi:hypothetical protein
VVLAQHGEVRDDVHGRDVAGDDDNARERGVAGGGRGRLSESLDDLLDTALQGVVLGGCEMLDICPKYIVHCSRIPFRMVL